MTIKYKMVQRTASPGEKGGERAAYPMITNRQKLTNEEFYKAIQEQVHFSKADIVGFLHALRAVLTRQMLEGNIVPLKTIGSFYPTVNYHGEPNIKRVKPEDMELNIRFRPLLDWKRKFFMPDFKKVKEQKV
jgi:predicted histone-like DNA-binding protein